MSAYLTVAGWMVATLKGDAAVTAAVGDRIWEGIAPQNATYPLITVQSYVDPSDTRYYGARALTTVEVLVRVWDSTPESRGNGSAARIAPVADRADALLTLTVPVERDGGRIADCSRYAEVNSTEYRDGAAIRSAGGRYRATVT